MDTPADPDRDALDQALRKFQRELSAGTVSLALLGVLAAMPILVGTAVKIETSDGSSAGGGGGEGPAFISQITNNGLFLVFTSLAATLPFFLPMTVGVVAGDSVAGEAAAGTLRYLLVAPAGRTRLLLAKYASTAVFCPPNVLHGIRNAGETPIRYMIIRTA